MDIMMTGTLEGGGKEGSAQKSFFPTLNNVTKTNEQCTYTSAHLTHHTGEVCLCFPKAAALPCLVSIDLPAERATIGYLKIMLQAAGPRATDCRHLRITTEELSGMFVSIQPLNRSAGLNGRRTFLEMETPTTSTPMTQDGFP